MSSQLPRLVEIHSHAVFNIGQGAPLAEQPSWSVEQSLSLMDRYGIETSVISVPDAANRATGQEASDVARRINEKIADIVAKHPRRFGGMVTVPGRDPERAVQEMEYGLDTLKLDAVATSTNIDDTYLGEARFDAWFQAMDKRGVTLFIHPSTLTSASSMDVRMNFSVLEFMFDTTRMLANMVITGAKKRFNNIKMISTHAGGTMPFLLKRMQMLEVHWGLNEGRTTIAAEEIKDVLASFYYDLTGSTTQTQINGLLEFVPTSQILMGVDMPFMPLWSIETAIHEVATFPRFSSKDIDLIAHENAARLFPSVAARIGSSVT